MGLSESVSNNIWKWLRIGVFILLSLQINCLKPADEHKLPEEDLTEVWKAEDYYYNGVALLINGRVAVACWEDRRVRLYTRYGKELSDYYCGFRPVVIAYHPQEETLVTAGIGTNLLFLKVEHGTLILDRTVELPEALVPIGLTVLQDGSIATTHKDVSYMNIWSTEGRIISRIDTPGINPLRISVHSDLIYVIKHLGKGLHVYNHQGELLHDWSGGQRGYFWNPKEEVYSAVAVDDRGYVWLAEYSKESLTVLDKHGKVVKTYDIDVKPEYITIQGNRLCVSGYSYSLTETRRLAVYKI